MAGPVLEGVRDEPLQGHHDAPQVPDPQDHIGCRDLLHPAPVPLYMENVINTKGFRQRNLHAGKQVLKHRARGKAQDDTADARGGKQAHPSCWTGSKVISATRDQR